MTSSEEPNEFIPKTETGNNVRDLFTWVVIPIAIVLIIRIFLLGFYIVPSGSMLDTIQLRDRVIAVKIEKPKRGDIVVFRDPGGWLSASEGEDLIKRVIGLPGDTVECAGNGQPVKVNGVALNESAYLKPGVTPSDVAFSVKVKPGMMWVMGDNRSSSADSRMHQTDAYGGQVPLSLVRGVARVTYWPVSRWGLMDSHPEVFSKVPNVSS
ncbi:signal peptidase I [Bifidobacterium callitrichidarum]|uniref:signal peptidase I n=1 Tax=Bifidobacterium callitrichidarum TaxID=2052941 RepID=UPI001F4E1BDB|nr:signal peptidase I [Bifidobacterium callitrichidarum]